MNAVKVAGNVNANHQLLAQVPESIPPGPVTVLIVPRTGEDDAGAAWAAGLAEAWADDLGDARQDIYTLDDGEPLDERR